MLSVELLVHRPADGAKDGAAHLERRQEADEATTADRPGDLLLEKVRTLDARHWEEHPRPASAETIRKELYIGAARS
ncbi:hypothetical protein ACFULQ_24770, partial [Streptomyces sp. NPDC057253]